VTLHRDKIFLCFILIFILIIPCIKSQDYSANYKPIRDYKPDSTLIVKGESKFRDWPNHGIFSSTKVKQKFSEFAVQKAMFLHSLDSMELLMFNDSISRYLNRIKDRIASHNPELKNVDFHVLTYRTAEPNAHSMGEGYIFVNLGLLERLNTEDQIAFVLAHEMGHDLARHSIKESKRLSESYYSDTYKKIRKSGRKKFERNSALHQMINSFFANNMRYSRANEVMADSMGYRFFINAGYAPKSAIETLNILDNADQLIYTDTLRLSAYFNFEEYAFKSYWLDPSNTNQEWISDSTLFNVPDSMKSHPDCKARIKLLEEDIKSMPGNDIPNVHQFDQLKPQVSFEVVQSLMESKDYVMAMFMSLQMKSQYPANQYLKCVTAHCLFELAEAMTRNEYLEYVNFPDKDYGMAYNKFLVFLHNMSSSTLRKLFTNYMTTNLIKDKSDPYVGFLKFVSDTQSPLTSNKIEEYNHQYHDDYFFNLLQEKLKNLTRTKK